MLIFTFYQLRNLMSREGFLYYNVLNINHQNHL